MARQEWRADRQRGSAACPSCCPAGCQTCSGKRPVWASGATASFGSECDRLADWAVGEELAVCATRARFANHSRFRGWVAVWLLQLLALSVPAAPAEQLLRTNQPGLMITKENRVEYIPSGQPAVVALTNQWLRFQDALRTLELSRATIRLTDWTQVYLKDRSRLEILPDAARPQAPSLQLHSGELYVSSRGGGPSIPVRTPHVQGKPHGTEFLVRVEPGFTEFTMFDGQVALSNEANPVPVPLESNQQALIEPGQPIRTIPLKARNTVVQWWLYYPAILDLRELEFTPPERTLLAASLQFYASGHLQRALESYPGYPALLAPDTDAQRLYQSALLLAVGAVDRSQALLASVSTNRLAAATGLQVMITAVTAGTNGAPTTSFSAGASPSESSTLALAISFAHQATNNLPAALASARSAVARSPEFGFGWARVAELEFGFGRTRAAHEAVDRALVLSPDNAQAQTVRGFLLAAEYRLSDAITAFDRALEIDPALGNAWLGRGLCKRRMGFLASRERRDSGPESSTNVVSWLSDLQTAAAVEPGRSLVRSYAGKAFGDANDSLRATKELSYAALLDPNDPTPPLYLALELQRQNRPNEAVRELERSIRLNYNRAVYRSRMLLDQDHATRSASLAKIYQDAGLEEVALREAARAVSYDYSSYSAHQFLAESYNALRDPTRFNLRYETVWFNELLLANILSPVGAGLLSQNISQQEYSRLFEANRVGLTTSSEYRSDGQFREVVSQYGLVGNSAYTLDLDYQHNEGTRPNNDLSRIEWYSQFKHQLNERDSFFLLTKYQDYESGDNFQRYNPGDASRKFRYEEKQAPILIGAVHREWEPGSHTTLLGGGLSSDVHARSDATVLDLFTNAPGGDVYNLRHRSFSNSVDHTEYAAYLVELNHLLQRERWLTVLGSRLQGGSFDARNVIDGIGNTNNYYGLPVSTQVDKPFRRFSVYGYETWTAFERLRLTAGLVYEYLSHPSNVRYPPLSERRETRNSLLPRAAVHWDVSQRISVRGMYAQSLGGLSYDESVRLEPTQLAGFAQTYRGAIPESEAGSVIAPRYDTAGLGLDAKPGPNTFLGAQALVQRAEVDQSIGVFRSPGSTNGGIPPFARVSTTPENLRYRETAFAFSLDQLAGNSWSFGISYRLTYSRLKWSYRDIPDALLLSPDRVESGLLHRWQGRFLYQHSGGLFACGQVAAFRQDSGGYEDRIVSGPRPGDAGYQVDACVGWRFPRRLGQIALGCLNITAQNYRLNALNAYSDLPRDRLWTGRVQLNF